MSEETFSFQAEVSKLLDIVAHSLYSHKEIFLRELISNASDACDKLRYQALTDASLTGGDGDFRIELTVDKKAQTLTISDNGIGMNRDELVDTLGTIARSGTQAFAEALSQAGKSAGKSAGKKSKDDASVDLIGQFGVGFYSAFMVAEKIEVTTRRAGDDAAWLWSSDGAGEFTISDAERESRGTDVKVFIKKADKEYLDPVRIAHIVKTYSDHIGLPVVLKGGGDDGTDKTLNTASALWTRAAKEISEKDYTEFYHHVGQVFDNPWLTLHNRVEGVIAYTNLLFIPSMRPFDLFDPARKTRIKLYVKRVFITDDCETILPAYLRFMRGVVDSEDLPLNISREMLQDNPALVKIRKALIKRVFGELKKKAEKAPKEFDNFWSEFGAVFKEGLYEDPENRDTLFEIVRFDSTTNAENGGSTTVGAYIERMKPGQEAIYYITGDDLDTLSASPQLEGFKAKGVEVLLLSDPVDEFWVSAIPEVGGKPLKSVTRGGADLGAIGKDDKSDDQDAVTKDDKPDASPATAALIAALKIALGDSVKDVRPSERLTDSPVCLISDDGDMDMRLERMLKQHRQLDAHTTRILEINPDHGLIKKLAERAVKGDGKDAVVREAAFLLLDQARIVEGEPVPDPVVFARRMAAMMEKGLVG